MVKKWSEFISSESDDIPGSISMLAEIADEAGVKMEIQDNAFSYWRLQIQVNSNTNCIETIDEIIDKADQIYTVGVATRYYGEVTGVTDSPISNWHNRDKSNDEHLKWIALFIRKFN